MKINLKIEKILPIIILAIVVAIAGCTQKQPETGPEVGPPQTGFKPGKLIDCGNYAPCMEYAMKDSCTAAKYTASDQSLYIETKGDKTVGCKAEELGIAAATCNVCEIFYKSASEETTCLVPQDIVERNLGSTYSISSFKNLGINICSKKSVSGTVQAATDPIAAGDPAFCNNFADAKVKDKCLLDIAKAIKDGKICQSITDGSLQRECIYLINPTIEGCRAIKDATQKSICLNYVVRKQGVQVTDASVCSEIIIGRDEAGGRIDPYYCYKKYVSYSNDYAACEKITTAFDHDQCLMSYIAKSSDPGVCGLLKYSTYQTQCKNNFESFKNSVAIPYSR